MKISSEINLENHKRDRLELKYLKKRRRFDFFRELLLFYIYIEIFTWITSVNWFMRNIKITNDNNTTKRREKQRLRILTLRDIPSTF